MGHLPDNEELEYNIAKFNELISVPKYRKRRNGKKNFGIKITAKNWFSKGTYNWTKKYYTAKARDEAFKRIGKKDRSWYLSVEKVDL